ncbi:SHOCT domain-containing protein [Nocardioides ungokensis]|uniref:SHOCT domain-containing protein n=1 Tax=Nocardioides ungokensis TaxID=1643322 RepID=UPI003CCC9470
MSEATPPPAGWYPNMGGHRYWDGTQWTDQFRPGTEQQQATPDKDPDAIWQAVGKPVTGIGAGKYKLTAQYLFFEKGTLRTDSQQVPTSAVLDVDVRQSMTQKARGVGNVIVHIQRPTRVEIVTMEDIPNFREGQKAINETAHAARIAIQRNQNTMRYEGIHPMQQGAGTPSSSPAAQTGPAPAVPDPIEQLQKLGQLRDAGILTEDEFLAKKTDILGRM